MRDKPATSTSSSVSGRASNRKVPMSYTAHNSGKMIRGTTIRLMALALLATACMRLNAQQTAAQQTAAQQTAAQQTAAQQTTALQTSPATQIDRVVAIVNDDLILESDVNEEQRFAVFQPYSDPAGSFTRAKAIQRLIDRDLIQQQARLQPRKPITDAEVAANLQDLRKDILACKEYKCDTPAGWQKFLQANGFTEAELIKRWRERMETLQFIEERFRQGIRIPDADVQDYYTKTLLPQYAARHATAPKLDSISDRIREILLQQQVGGLLDDWLKALRASGSVRMVTASEVTE